MHAILNGVSDFLRLHRLLTLYPVAFSNFLSRPSLEFDVVNFWFDSDEPKPMVLAYKTPSGF